ncbi:structural maintenance of chromosomes protein 3 [Schistocerca americana]|uniref:structural maintenance of chromosomes protein 3 n=1 Tax=Schistocerca americana TaxID=7009 RepID=UPI001F4FB2B1|nr:structural maintenance of chromosomes protein 3 [Schistocerca americana]XP_047113915.1 structural maintenance of chromosomes protein 3 [Schistocerca piceifrons]XP_049780497.1 structural maintenance of chromosomes protein 3 [Schistocerca cancellata]XP_049815737.1 structural maintenance of chromosomes protein 3 [Schistocerca nitens]XP_049858680.1 structural maintenance of chromosomes protein 3 [Schistocerca gregaria]XP_049957946.1 structural maintenance of chromosomes protein 3 [Schistocerca 
MYIKQVIIQGFKSYREQTVVEPFDPRHNVVVGRNGSGKSNFFYAIQFVLSDEFSHLRPEQRQALLHEGTGPRVLNAYVEIIFDNTDGRLPIDKEEVYLRRVIGAKKDQYFLNKKIVPRSDVMNLLESAGFSRSNPYYIVKQGKINQMATAPDSHRLKLLREVAGTRVYDERREESKAILKETEGKLDKIEEFLRTIEERLKTLEEEKEELKEYQKWDKMRRSLEYTIHDRELKENREKLDNMEKQRKMSGEEQKKFSAEQKVAQEKIRTAVRNLKEAKKIVQTLKEERDTLSADQQQLLKEKTKLELTIKDLSDEVMGDNTSKERAENELAKLKVTISHRQEELANLQPKYEEMKKKEEDCTKELALKEQKRKELYAKQGRGSQFTSKEERDQWIMRELRSLNKQIKDKQDHATKLEEDIKKDIEKKALLLRKIEEQTNELEKQRACIDEHNKQFYDFKKTKDQYQSKRNELWRKENALQQTLTSLKEDLAKADQSLRSMAGKPILNGRDSVRKVLETFRERGGSFAEIANCYYGPVIENFDCEKSIYTAVEVTAGNRLFHHIVESDKVGTQILKEMNRQKLPGEVTFMPLNRLHVRDQEYPETNDAIAMVTKLNYENRYDKALKYIFGKTLICRNLEVATNLARTSQLDCVTLEGDQVSSKGSLTGGYFNTSRSRLEIQKTRSELSVQIRDAEAELGKLRAELREIEDKINRIVSDMQKTETKNSKAKDIFDKVKADIRLMKEEVAGIERYHGPKVRSLDQYASSLEAMRTTKEGLEAELHQELMSQLSVQDQLEVDQLNDDIRRLTQENKEAFSTRMRLEAEKNKLENLLTNNLNRRHDELVQALQEISVEERQQKLKNCKAELEIIDKRIENVNREFKAVEKKVQEALKKQKNEQVEQDTWKQKEKEIQEKIDEDAKDLEKMAAKQNMLQQKIAECTKKIQELGALPPPEMYLKYQNMSTKNLFKEMEKANSQLKKYSHVNKKALDQFMSFSDQKEKLMKRKEELDRGDEKIKELMSVLEQRKYEAIEFTFKQVSKYFSEVFQKLVPGGHAQLVMKKNDDETGGPQEEGESDKFTGVGIRVSFTGRHAEMREMNQLSGGQKSLVALGLIFAIQKCDPAPFYLFDEIDQALDSQHRMAVANMIHELSKDAQFITTTFRPELLVHANKFYGVKFRNKVSHVECVTREVAADFVEDDTTTG